MTYVLYCAEVVYTAWDATKNFLNSNVAKQLLHEKTYLFQFNSTNDILPAFIAKKKRKIMSLPRALINITLLQVISHSVTYFRSTTELISYILKFKWPAGDHVQQMLYESNWRLQELYNPISQLPIKYFSVASRGKNIVVSFITIVNKSTYVFRFVLED